MKTAFAVYNTQYSEVIASIWMDPELFKDDSVIDPTTMTLRNIRNGGIYTLLLLEDARFQALKDVRDAYHKITKQPVEMFSTTISRMDGLLLAVGRLFTEVEYIVVNGPDDLDKIINPVDDHEFETIKMSILDQMAKDRLEELTESYDASAVSLLTDEANKQTDESQDN